MKNIFIIISIMVLIGGIIEAGTITKTLNFSEQDLRFQQINEPRPSTQWRGTYTLVSLTGTVPYQIPGKPIIPVAVYNVLVPANAEVTEINVISKREVELAGKYYLYPSQAPKPIGIQGETDITIPIQSIYNSSQVYPAKLVDLSSTGTKSGYRIASFAVYPVRYIPSAQQLSLITSLTLEIKYEENKVALSEITSKQREIFSQDVKNIIINPDDLNRYAPLISSVKENEIDCTIITSDGLVSNFQPLVDWHNKKGFRTEVKGTSWISSNYSGRDLQEKIRNFIRDYFTNRGLKWVILGGDNSYVPARQARASVSPYTGNIPCDLYYADLQWSWDGNHNNIFGEAGYDTVDFFADVYVGRLSVETGTEINNVINKIFTYEKNPDPNYLKKMLLPAAYLWSGYVHRQSQDSISNMSPAGWTDRVIDLGTNDGLRYLVRDSINNGFGLVHLVGHGDDVGVYISSNPQYNVNDPATQTNSNKLAVVNSIACYPGNFEYSDCLAEKMLLAQNCAVAVIMCSRYGWGTPPTIGPSELLDVRFYDFFFNRDSCFIGSCHSSSKDVYRYLAENQQVWRWCVFELHLFGDPIMPIWSEVPRAVTIDRPGTFQTGPRILTVTVTSSGAPIANALVGVYKQDEVYTRGFTNALGQVNISVNALTTGVMYITASGENCFPLEDSVTVTSGGPQAYLVLYRVSPTQVDPNQTVAMTAMVRNSGTANSNNTIGNLRTNSNFITLYDSVSSYGNLLPSDTAAGDGYSYLVSAATPQGSQIPFTLNLTSDQGSWNYNFNIQCGQEQQPGRTIANHDTGYCSLTVTAMGSIGYDQPAEKSGSGFRYPKTGISALYFCSMLAGNSAGYLVDRYYGQPASSLNQDWRIVDSLRFVTPPILGSQQLRCSYSDAGHASPRGLKVTQNSYSISDSRYDDFIVLVYDYLNTGAMPISGLYSGIITDFDIKPESSATDIARSDVIRRLVYMRRAVTQNPTVGVKLLFPTVPRSLVAIDHDRYVYPDSAMTESMKFRILNGTLGLSQSNRTYDWSVAASTGPIDLAPTQTTRVAFAFVGGSSETEMLANADSAQAWFDHVSLAGISDENDGKVPNRSPRLELKLTPNPSKLPLRITYNLINPGHIKLGLYDISGQLTSEIFNGKVNNTTGIFDYRLKDLPSGVYFVKLATDKNMVTKKFLLVK